MRNNGRFEIDPVRKRAALDRNIGESEGIKILVVDDHALIRHGLTLIVKLRYPDAMVLEAGSLAEALARVESAGRLSAVLFDLHLDDCDGLQGVVAMLGVLGPVPLLVISGSLDHRLIADCIRAGARGFVPKGAEAGSLDHALPIILGGGLYAPLPGQAMAGPGADGQAAAGQGLGSAMRRSRSVVPQPVFRHPTGIDQLTGRQREVLALLLEGCSNKEIARSLGVLEGTVKVHMRSVMQRLGVRNRTQLALVAMKSGLVAEGERIA